MVTKYRNRHLSLGGYAIKDFVNTGITPKY